MSNTEHVEARDLILKPALSFDQRVRLAALLRIHLVDESITENNLFQTAADSRFMAHYYPGDSYRSPPIVTGTLSRYGHTLASAVRGDYASLATEALITAARHGVVDRVVSAILPAPRTAHTMPIVQAPSAMKSAAVSANGAVSDQARRDAIKREIRLLALSRSNLRPEDRDRLVKLLGAHHRKGPVTHENYVFVALNFLRAYYPADFEAEKRKWKESRPPPPTSRNQGRNSNQETPFALFHPYLPAVVPPPIRLSFVTPLPVAAPASDPSSAPAGADSAQNLQVEDSAPLLPSRSGEESDTAGTVLE